MTHGATHSAVNVTDVWLSLAIAMSQIPGSPLVKRLRILPAGVLSKKRGGERMTDSSMLLKRRRDARSVLHIAGNETPTMSSTVDNSAQNFRKIETSDEPRTHADRDISGRRAVHCRPRSGS